MQLCGVVRTQNPFDTCAWLTDCCLTSSLSRSSILYLCFCLSFSFFASVCFYVSCASLYFVILRFCDVPFGSSSIVSGSSKHFHFLSESASPPLQPVPAASLAAPSLSSPIIMHSISSLVNLLRTRAAPADWSRTATVLTGSATSVRGHRSRSHSR